MTRTAAAFALFFAACSAPESARVDEAPIVERAHPSDPGSSPEKHGAAAPDDDRSLPSSIQLDASMTRSGPGGGPPVTASLHGGKPVEWSRTELRLEQVPFDPRQVVARRESVEHLNSYDHGEGTLRIGYTLHGVPEDAMFVELDTVDSRVTWSDGTKGGLRGVDSQSVHDGVHWMDVLTTAPPTGPAIQLLRLALDLHRPVRVARSEAQIGVDEAVSVDLGSVRMKWTLSEDLQVTGFASHRRAKSLVPLLDRGLEADRLVRLVDAEGKRLRRSVESGAGSSTITLWCSPDSNPLVPPVRVTVDVPLETATQRVVVHLQDLSPGR